MGPEVCGADVFGMLEGNSIDSEGAWALAVALQTNTALISLDLALDGDAHVPNRVHGLIGADAQSAMKDALAGAWSGQRRDPHPMRRAARLAANGEKQEL